MEDLNTAALELLNQDSRYMHDLNVIEYNELRMYDVPYFTTMDNDDNDEFLAVTSEYFDRLDKVAYDGYMNSRYWWIIALLNHIDNPFDVKSDVILRLPSINKLIMREVI